MKSLISLQKDIKKHGKGIFLQDFNCFNSLYHLSTLLDIFTVQILLGQGFVSKSFREIFIFTKSPWVGRLIVEAEVRTSFLS